MSAWLFNFVIKISTRILLVNKLRSRKDSYTCLSVSNGLHIKVLDVNEMYLTILIDHSSQPFRIYFDNINSRVITDYFVSKINPRNHNKYLCPKLNRRVAIEKKKISIYRPIAQLNNFYFNLTATDDLAI